MTVNITRSAADSLTIVVGDVDHRLRWIPPGRFLMGSPETEVGRWDDEGPVHEVELSAGYWLGETPVTQALWEAVMGENPSHFQGATRPVEQVSFEDCQEFLGRLNQLVPGLGARLPTEAEWERACRAGTQTATWRGDLRPGEEAAVLERIAWYDETSNTKTHPVRKKKPNPFGLYDMLGNVWEWCADWYGPYQAGLQVDPVGPPAGSERALRGGSFASWAGNVRAATRDSCHPGGLAYNVGFRLAGGLSARSSTSGGGEVSHGMTDGDAHSKGANRLAF